MVIPQVSHPRTAAILTFTMMTIGFFGPLSEMATKQKGDGVGVVPEVPTLHHQRQGQTDVDEQAVPSPPKTALGTGEEDDTL